jgi:hypothetical protein
MFGNNEKVRAEMKRRMVPVTKLSIPVFTATFPCVGCGRIFGGDQANLDAGMSLICDQCYLADPPAEDVDSVFAEVIAHMANPGGS